MWTPRPLLPPAEPDVPPWTRRGFLRSLGALAAAATAGAVGWRQITEKQEPAMVTTVRQYGASGDGVADDTSAFEKALKASSSVYVPPGTYVLRRPLEVPPATRVTGGGMYNTRLLHEHDGDFATLRAQSSLSDLTVAGQGGQRRGRGLVLSGDDGQQSLQAVAVVGFDGFCIDFETLGAGSQFRAVQVDVARVDAATGSGRYAIHVAGGEQLSAVPRSFVQLETQGQCAIDFGGCNDMYVSASTLGDMAFTPNSRGVNITGSRLLNQQQLTIDGHGVTIVGCDISAQITVAPGADNVVVTPNSFNQLPVIDRSGNDRNQLPAPYPR